LEKSWKKKARNKTTGEKPSINREGEGMMKKFTNIVRVLVGIGLLASVVGKASATQLVNEQFNYSDGDLTVVSGGAWTSFSGSTPLNVVSGQAVVNQTNSADDQISLGGTYGTGTVLYASFDVNFSALPAGPSSYFALFKDSTTSDFGARVWVTTNGVTTPGDIRIGIANSASQPTNAGVAFIATDLSLGTTYKVVIKLDSNVGANGSGTLWLNPTQETDPSVTATDKSYIDPWQDFALRQASTSQGAGVETVDNLLVGTTFADVVAVPEPSTVVLVGAGLIGMLFLRRRRHM
jgi:hypothetical protein